jgi:hypothetical protein
MTSSVAYQFNVSVGCSAGYRSAITYLGQTGVSKTEFDGALTSLWHEFTHGVPEDAQDLGDTRFGVTVHGFRVHVTVDHVQKVITIIAIQNTVPPSLRGRSTAAI